MLGTLLGTVSFTATEVFSQEALGFGPVKIEECFSPIGFPETTKIDEPPTRSQKTLLNRTRVSFRGLRPRAREQEIGKQQGRASGTHF